MTSPPEFPTPPERPTPPSAPSKGLKGLFQSERVRRLFRFMGLPFRLHIFGSMAILIFACVVMGSQIDRRSSFASGELFDDVMDRWGAPIEQPMPSVRYVESGSTFNTLHAKPLDAQQVILNADMNYRKRGLVYFSGFDFDFMGNYLVNNDEGRDLDIVFVFPLSMERKRILLSALKFKVNGEETDIELSKDGDKLVWTGRLKVGESLSFDISFSGRGLDSFRYELDPSLATRNFDLQVNITGGNNYDYPYGVVPAHMITEYEDGDGLEMRWHYESLESGVPLGVTLPSVKGFDAIIELMLMRAWAPFFLFFLALWGVMTYGNRRLKILNAYLVSACFAFFYVLLPYLAAFMHFYLAYIVSTAVIFFLLYSYIRALIGKEYHRPIILVLVAFLVIPNLAVVLKGYTGLIYTLEILAGLVVLTKLIQLPEFEAGLAKL